MHDFGFSKGKAGSREDIQSYKGLGGPLHEVRGGELGDQSPAGHRESRSFTVLVRS